MAELPDEVEVAADLNKQMHERGILAVEMHPFVAFVLCGMLQLALRHPGNNGATAENVANFVNDLAAQLPESAQSIIAAGWNPGYDQ